MTNACTHGNIENRDGGLFIDGKLAANFELANPMPLFLPSDFKKLTAIQVLVTPPISEPSTVVLDVGQGTLAKQILQQMPECRIMGKKTLNLIDAYIMSDIRSSTPTDWPSLYFREQGLHHLSDGTWIAVCGDRLIGDCGSFSAALHPSLNALHLATDESLSATEAVAQQFQNMARHQTTVLPAFGFTQMSALRSEIMKRGGVSTFPLLSIVGQQNYGKTVLATRQCLLYDHRGGKAAAKLGAISTEKGLVASTSGFRDQVVLIDDLGIGSHTCVEKKSLQVMSMILRYGANDSERHTATSSRTAYSQACQVGIAFTGELPFTSASDCSRIIQIKLTEPLRDGSPSDRTVAATAFRYWLEWFLAHADEQFDLLDRRLTEADQVKHARLQNTYILMSWVLESFYRYARDIGCISATLLSTAISKSTQALRDILGQQTAHIEKSGQTNPIGNIAWYILHGYKAGHFHVVSARKKLLNDTDCIIERDCLCIRSKALSTYVNQNTPYCISDRKLGKQLQELNVCPDYKEKRSAGKKINGSRYLEIDLIALKKAAIRF